MSGEHGSPFPHDGEHGRSCTGYGCDCDEKNYGYHGGGHGNSEGSGAWIWLLLILGVIIGTAINELLGVIILLVIAFVAFVSR